jgi:hypothetical protein
VLVASFQTPCRSGSPHGVRGGVHAFWDAGSVAAGFDGTAGLGGAMEAAFAGGACPAIARSASSNITIARTTSDVRNRFFI